MKKVYEISDDGLVASDGKDWYRHYERNGIEIYIKKPPNKLPLQSVAYLRLRLEGQK